MSGSSGIPLQLACPRPDRQVPCAATICPSDQKPVPGIYRDRRVTGAMRLLDGPFSPAIGKPSSPSDHRPYDRRVRAFLTSGFIGNISTPGSAVLPGARRTGESRQAGAPATHRDSKKLGLLGKRNRELVCLGACLSRK
jgi:hypothetical protein